MSTPTSADIHTALRRIVATGAFPPWRGADPDVTQAEVSALWLRVARERSLTREGMSGAVDRWCASAAGKETRWPHPGDVLPAAQASARSCGDCASGWREVAAHREIDGNIVVQVSAVRCDCALGEQTDRGDAEHPRRTQSLQQVSQQLSRDPTVLRWFVDPTQAQRQRLDAPKPTGSAAIRSAAGWTSVGVLTRTGRSSG